MADEYGQYEQVNGGMVNDLRNQLAKVTDERDELNRVLDILPDNDESDEGWGGTLKENILCHLQSVDTDDRFWELARKADAGHTRAVAHIVFRAFNRMEDEATRADRAEAELAKATDENKALIINTESLMKRSENYMEAKDELAKVNGLLGEIGQWTDEYAYPRSSIAGPEITTGEKETQALCDILDRRDQPYQCPTCKPADLAIHSVGSMLHSIELGMYTPERACRKIEMVLSLYYKGEPTPCDGCVERDGVLDALAEEWVNGVSGHAQEGFNHFVEEASNVAPPRSSFQGNPSKMNGILATRRPQREGGG